MLGEGGAPSAGRQPIRVRVPDNRDFSSLHQARCRCVCRYVCMCVCMCVPVVVLAGVCVGRCGYVKNPYCHGYSYTGAPNNFLLQCLTADDNLHISI